MKSLFWRFVICLLPCVLAGWLTTVAFSNYYAGQSGRINFKPGVDLVGGTILVYEIDTRKQAMDRTAGPPTDTTALLADALKRRIDPNDLYNVQIRPAGGEGRVEIILPTGGKFRTEKAEQIWKEVIAEMERRHQVSALEAGRGNVLELAEKIHQRIAEKIWTKVLFGDEKGWKDLVQRAFKERQWTELRVPMPTSAASLAGALGLLSGPSIYPMAVNAKLHTATWREQRQAKFNALKPGELTRLTDLLVREIGSATNEASVQKWIKRQAWSVLLERVRDKWPDLKNYLLDPEGGDELTGLKVRVPPDSNEQLVALIQSRGSVVGEAVLFAVAPLMGSDVTSDNKDLVAYKDAAEFVEKNYGKSLQSIVADVEDIYRKSGGARDLTAEEVQRIKDLVSKVGSLEFRILANDFDDKDAIAAAKALLEREAANDEQLQELQNKGLPPPAPMRPDDPTRPQVFELSLARGTKSKVTYAWVELGPQMRRQLGLDNAAETDPQRNRHWLEAKKYRGRQAHPLTNFSGKGFLEQGALFYSRECKDRNLPEEERRTKAVEYFVLTRNPELDPVDPLERTYTPKIDGSYLVSAYPDRSGVSPAVHFSFNKAGGDLFRELTRKNVPSQQGGDEIKRHLAIILDSLVMSAPTINSEIGQQGQITGHFTAKELDSLVNILRAGALPASLKPQPVSESTMGAQLGEDTIRQGLYATLIAFIVVMAFMIVYYRFAGLVASVALFANLLLTVGFMIGVQATFTLPGIAGLVLMIGMAVDANVLIYERLREERERGATLSLALRNAYDRALPTIIDTHLSSIFTAIVLYIVGNDQLKGFGVSLTAGLIISLFTSLYMTRFMFDFWQSRQWLRKLSMMKFFTKPDIDFMAIRYYMFAVTVGLAVIGAVVFIGRMPYDLNIDFIGGTAYGGQLYSGLTESDKQGKDLPTALKAWRERFKTDKAKTIDELRELLDEKNFATLLKIERVVEDEGSDGLRFHITYKNPNGTEETRPVALANKIEGGARDDRQKALQERAQKLPDIAIEQIFPGFDVAPSGASHYFTVRTSERETELVQTSLDRLLREQDKEKPGHPWVPLMKKVYMRSEPVSSKGTRLHFYATEPSKDFDVVQDVGKEREKQWPKEFASPSFVRTLFTREMLKLFDKKEKRDLPFQFDVAGEGTSKEGRYRVLKLEFPPDAKITKDDLAKVERALATTVTEFEARPQPERLENFDSQLAGETRLRAMWAILASWGAVALYLWFRFGSWTFGLAAVICLIHDLFFTLGIIAACHYVHDTWLFGEILMLQDFKVDLPCVAALLTLIGYSVNDTIVVFDRIREVRGKNPDLTPGMINESINQTLSRTILTGLCTMLVVAVLYWFGGPGIHLFAFVIVIGVVIGTYSSIYVASPLLLIFGEGQKSAERVRPPQPIPEPEGAAV